MFLLQLLTVRKIVENILEIERIDISFHFNLINSNFSVQNKKFVIIIARTYIFTEIRNFRYFFLSKI